MNKLDINSSHHEWTDYILSHLEENEKVKGYPTTAGLRRICEIFLGKLIKSTTKIQQTPDDKFYSCTAIHKMVFQQDEQKYTYTGAANTGQYNTQGVFLNYIVEVAETKAEGRCLRRALKLQTLVAEEIAGTDIKEQEKITESQKNLISVLSGGPPRGINVKINAIIKDRFRKDDINELTKNQGLILIKTLSSYQNNPNDIPEEYRV